MKGLCLTRTLRILDGDAQFYFTRVFRPRHRSSPSSKTLPMAAWQVPRIKSPQTAELSTMNRSQTPSCTGSRPVQPLTAHCATYTDPKSSGPMSDHRNIEISRRSPLRADRRGTSRGEEAGRQDRRAGCCDRSGRTHALSCQAFPCARGSARLSRLHPRTCAPSRPGGS